VRVRVLTLHFGGAPYLQVSRDINERYCRRYGLEFIVAPALNNGRHPAWSKVARALGLLGDCDALLYIDGDAVFVDHARGPQVLTERLTPTRAMLVGEDFTRGVANTGVWLLRNSTEGHAILRDWSLAPEVDPSLTFRWPVDEAGFNEQVLPRHRDAIDFIPRSELDLVKGDFIRHYMAEPAAAKTIRLQRERKCLERRSGSLVR